MLSEILSIVGLGNSYISGVKMGKKIDQIIDQSKKLNSTIERIAEHLFYAPDVEEVYSSHQEKISDYRLIRENLEPIQQAFNHDLLSTAMVTTSQKLKEAFNKDPFEVLDFIRPITRSKEHPNPDMVPIIFEDANIRYVGWIMKGLLPVVFGFEYDNKSNLHLPSKAVVNLKDLRQTEEKKYPIIFNSEMCIRDSLITELRAVTPDSLQYLITDMFEEIVFYENSIQKANIKNSISTHYEVSLEIDSKKFNANTEGILTPVQFNDWVEVGVYTIDKNGKEVLGCRKMYRLKPGNNEIIIPLEDKPTKAVIDPDNLLMDRNADDNIWKF